jgi:acyl-CoA thioester hydrolase
MAADADREQARSPDAFSECVRVRYRDTDAQGHLYFASYLVYADEVATSYAQALGFAWSDPQATPCLVFTANITCDYLGECRYGDTVRVAVGYGRLGNSSARLDFELREDAGGELLARGAITQVFASHETRRPAPMPAALREAIIARQPELA